MPVGDDETLASSQPAAKATGALEGGELIANRYQIVRWLGGGGMGAVYEVVDTELDERVALKVLKASLATDALDERGPPPRGSAAEWQRGLLERFRREVKLTRRIHHKNVARMFDIGDHEGEKFLTMELVDGESLAARAGTAVPWTELQPLAAQICAGLSAAHATGVVHRDLKPDNVLIERGSGRAVITDFGIARSGADPTVTQLGAVIGTPRYMSPEQLAGREVDAKSDLFSLGIMLFELATATRPWSGDSAIAIAIAQQTQPARSLIALVPPSFAALVTRCIALDPAQRPASAEAVREAIEQATEAPAALVATASAAPTLSGVHRTIGGVPTHVTHVTTVAVLPVACGPGDEYLADGMLDDLIDTLSSSPTMRVRPAGVVRSVTEPDPRIVGKRLEVDHVVVASIRRGAAKLRIAARLINVADGFQVWVHRTECTEAEILEVSEDVGRGIAAALSSRASIQTRPTDPRAVDLFLRARAELRRFWGSHVQQAAELLEEAAAIAPTSGPILGALAYARTQNWIMRGDVALAPIARAAIERGLASGHGDAHLAQALYALNMGELEEGARELGVALARAPMSAHVHEHAARILVETEATSEARHHFATALALDPGRAPVHDVDLARLDALLGDWDSAMRRVQTLLENPDPAISQLGAICETRLSGWRGDRARVVSAATRFLTRPGADGPEALLGWIRSTVETGALDLEAWHALAARFAAPGHPKRPRVFSFQILVEVSVSLGNEELALAVLEEANRAGLIDVIWLDRCPLFERMRPLPQFRDIRDLVSQRALSVQRALRAS